jgi:hypothetical protein
VPGYSIVTQYPTVEYLGGTQTKDVMAVGVRTNDHGVYFEFRLDKKAYTAANVKSDANGYTIVYELLFDIDGVTDVEWSQQPTAAGELQDHVTVYFTSSSGNSSSFIDFPYSRFTQDIISAAVGKARAVLDDAESGG